MQGLPTTRHPVLARLPVPAGNVCLRALRTDDIDEFLAYRGDPEIARYPGWKAMDRAAALAFLQCATPPRWGEGDWARVPWRSVCGDHPGEAWMCTAH